VELVGIEADVVPEPHMRDRVPAGLAEDPGGGNAEQLAGGLGIE
jgi:hypothetical protein